MTTTKNAESKLYNSVAIAALKGNKIEPGSFGTREYNPSTYDFKDSGHVCLCGAVLVAAGISLYDLDNAGSNDDVWTGEKIIKTAAKKLGITIRQAASLNNGFEDAYVDDEEVTGVWDDEITLKNGADKKWFGIGKNLRKVYDSANA